MSEISLTPMTDSQVIRGVDYQPASSCDELVDADYARTLEREKTALEQTVRELKQYIENLKLAAETQCSLVQVLREDLEEAQQQIKEAKKLRDHWCDKYQEAQQLLSDEQTEVGNQKAYVIDLKQQRDAAVAALQENSRCWAERECMCDPGRTGTECHKHHCLGINKEIIDAARAQAKEGK